MGGRWQNGVMTTGRVLLALLLASGPAAAGTAEAPEPVDYSGRWTITSTCSTGASDATITVARIGARRFSVVGDASTGAIEDGLFTMEHVEGINVSRYRSTFLTASRMEGAYTQVTHAELCRWVAVRS